MTTDGTITSDASSRCDLSSRRCDEKPSLGVPTIYIPKHLRPEAVSPVFFDLETGAIKFEADGQFRREVSTFRNWISKDPNSKFSAERGRYAIYASPTCPWAHRTMIVRALKHLEDVVDLNLVGSLSKDGWAFDGKNGALTEDPLHGYKLLRDLYTHANPKFEGRVTVPVLWDKKLDTMVSNESAEIIRMLFSEFDEFLPEEHREVSRLGGGFYPEPSRKEIDDINEWVYDTINNGVYKTGFSKTQKAYEENVLKVFESLDRIEDILGHGKPFLLGDHLTEADIRLYTTAARFDVGYHSQMLCNLKSIRHDYPRIHLWLRRLYWDQSEHTAGAFYRTTSPWVQYYGRGYAEARHTNVTPESVMIVSIGPATKIEPLKEGEGIVW